MSELFAREWRVSIGSGTVAAPLLTAGDSAALSTSDLRIAFSIKKTLTKEPNSCELRISNLSDVSRNKLNQKHMPVIVEAGYRGSLGVVFSGDSRTVDHIRESADWTTLVHCGDGERAYNFGRVSESFGPNTPVTTVIRNAAQGLGIGLGNLDSVLAIIPAIQVFKHGFTAFGPASSVLEKALAAAGYTYSIQNNALQIQRDLQAVNPQAFLLSPESGLVGSPEHTAPNAKGKPAVLKVRALLNHRLLPGNIVRVQSRAVDGEFIIQVVEHTGDSHGADWFTNLECTARVA